MLAKLGGVHVETIRYYERKGLLRQPARAYGSIRRYDHDHLGRLQFIRRAQAAGFTLADVKALLRLHERPSCRATRELTIDKLRSVEARIAQLASVREELRSWIAQCDANPDEASCPTLNAIEGHPHPEDGGSVVTPYVGGPPAGNPNP
jgi:MerR family mercuric resistance operon transcriptional regulator